jgi:uncharacterized protein YggE
MANSRNRIFLATGLLAVVALMIVAWATLARAQDGGSSNAGSPTVVAQTTESSASGDGSGVAYDGPSGIWVSGNGKASGAPDLAVISLGVESLEETAAEARANAAEAMSDVMDVLTEAEVSSEDIQTSHFNISPRYQAVEVERCEDDVDNAKVGAQTESSETCYKVWENRLVGYTVSNQASVKIRDLDDVGTIIDEVAEAAGDLVRIRGISFNIEDPQDLQDEARADAVADMERRAELLAELSGVALGPLVYINEGSSFAQPPQPVYARGESGMMGAAGASTSISGGQLEFSMRVQGVYLIQDGK